MRVGYSRGWAVSFLVLGAITVGINLLARNPLGFVPGIVCLIVGVGYLKKPYFFIESGQLVVPAVVGPLKKVYPFSPGGLVAREGALHLGPRKLGLRRWLADKQAWDAVARSLDSAATFD